MAAAAEEERVLERLASGVEEAGFKEEKQQGLAGEAAMVVGGGAGGLGEEIGGECGGL